MALETFQLRGKNYDDVVRQLVTTYNVSNGWAVVRVVNRLTSLDVILERNSEQAKDNVKVSPPTESNTKLVDTVVDTVVEQSKPVDKPTGKTTTRKAKVETPKTDEE